MSHRRWTRAQDGSRSSRRRRSAGFPPHIRTSGRPIRTPVWRRSAAALPPLLSGVPASRAMTLRRGTSRSSLHGLDRSRERMAHELSARCSNELVPEQVRGPACASQNTAGPRPERLIVAHTAARACPNRAKRQNIFVILDANHQRAGGSELNIPDWASVVQDRAPAAAASPKMPRPCRVLPPGVGRHRERRTFAGSLAAPRAPVETTPCSPDAP